MIAPGIVWSAMSVLVWAMATSGIIAWSPPVDLAMPKSISNA